MEYSKEFAKQVLQFNSQWESTNQSIIADNVEKYLYIKFPECLGNWSTKVSVISEMTKSKKDTVYAWLNRGRENVKVPLLKLCMLAVEFDVSVEEFFKENEE